MTKKAKRILDVLDAMFPDATVELTHTNTYELLVAVILSAQATDVSVNKVTPLLFKTYPTISSLSQANINDVENIIKTIGLYKTKAKNIVRMANQLIDTFGGIIPNNREDLESLSGVGRKTANVVLSNAFNIPLIAVDTHVHRVSIRLGIADKKDSVWVTEQKLYKTFPKERYTKLHHQMIFFGRYHCLARNPKCKDCQLYDVCVYENKTA